MTGPEHFAEAERLLDFYPDALPAAQVHATLALAATVAAAAAPRVWIAPAGTADAEDLAPGRFGFEGSP